MLTDAFLRGRTFAETTCQVNLKRSLTKGDGPRQLYTESRTAPFVDVFIAAEDGTVTSGDTPQEAVGSAGSLHYAIRNPKDGERFDPADAGRPDFSDADIGEIYELKITFHNHTVGLAGGGRSGTFLVHATGPEGLRSTFTDATSDAGAITSNEVRYWIS